MDEIDGIAIPPEGPGLCGRRADTIAIVPQGNAALLQMAEQTGDLIALCGANGELTYLNPAGRRLIGIADADIFPMRLSDYVVPQQRWRVDAEIVPTARAQGVWEGEMQLVNLQDDRIIDVLRSTYATRDEQGNVAGFVSVMRDITPIRAEEARLRELTKSLEQQVRARTIALHGATERLAVEAERREAMQTAHLQSQKLEAVGQLTSGIAHDFNNILGAVIGGFTVIQHHTEDDRVRHVATIGQRAAERGAALIRQLMAFTRMQDVVPEPIELASTIAEMSTLIAHGVGAGVEVAIACSDDIWPVLADVAQLQSALLNLANNASDAMRGRGTLRIALRNRPAASPDHPAELAERDAVVIDVADDGPGMDSATLQRITEPFFTTKGPGKGTGLGLAMVQRFVEQAQGAIRIESRLGQGSTFSIFLPRAFGHADSPPPAEDGDGDALIGRAFETVLLVDDDAGLTSILAEGLGDAGFDVLTAPDGETALGLVRTRGIDVLVTDVDMPGMNGIALVAQVRALSPEMPCVFMTGMTEPCDLAGETVIQKPFTPATLQYALRRRLAVRNRAASDTDRIERLGQRLKSACARALFDHWSDVRRGARVPSIAAFDIAQCSEPHRIIVAEIDLGRVPIAFTFTVVDDTLRRAVSGDASASMLAVSGDDSFGAREAAYRRCAISGRPSYEYARIDLGEGRTEIFERLLLPFSTQGGVVDRIVGAVVIEQSPREDAHADRQ